jgi:hypothetical protein
MIADINVQCYALNLVFQVCHKQKRTDLQFLRHQM